MASRYSWGSAETMVGIRSDCASKKPCPVSRKTCRTPATDEDIVSTRLWLRGEVAACAAMPTNTGSESTYASSRRANTGKILLYTRGQMSDARPTLRRCPLCDGEQLVHQFTQNTTPIVRCNRCGL